jgi:hypothetical protein
MASTRLKRSNRHGTETYSIWVEGSRLCFCNAFFYDRATESGSKGCGTPAKAQAALEAKVTELVKRGYALEGKKKPAPPPKPSKARPAKAPAWLKKLTAPLAKQKQRLEALARKAGLAHRFPEIVALMRPSVAFGVKPTRKLPAKLVSRLGGDPDLNDGAKWPTHAGRPLHFVAQIALSEIAASDLDGILPKTGHIAIFAQLDHLRDDYGAIAQALYVDDRSSVKRVAPPKGAESRMTSIGVLHAKPHLTLPYYEDPNLLALRLSGDERSTYHDEVYLNAFPKEPAHLCLGYASYGTGYSLEGKRFLAQIDCDDRVGFSEGDANTLRIYFKSKKPTKNDLAVVCCLEQA